MSSRADRSRASPGAPGALGSDFVLDWSAVPGADFFEHQHNVHVRSDGRLGLLDNVNGRALVLALDPAADLREYDAIAGTEIWRATLSCPSGPPPARWYPLDGW